MDGVWTEAESTVKKVSLKYIIFLSVNFVGKGAKFCSRLLVYGVGRSLAK